MRTRASTIEHQRERLRYNARMASECPVIWLGVAESCSVQNVTDPTHALHIQGLRSTIRSIVYPASLNQWCLMILIRRDLQGKFELSIRHPDQSSGIRLTLTLQTEGTGPDLSQKWGLLACRPPASIPLFATEPVPYIIEAIIDDVAIRLGDLNFIYAPSPCLTKDEIRAVNATVNAKKAVRMKIECNKCHDFVLPLASIEKPPHVAPPMCWYEDLPEHFTCTCGSFSVPLRYLRESMHGLLRPGVRLGARGEIAQGDRLYTEEIIERTFAEFVKLLKVADCEEDIQTFLEDHPILFCSFSPRHLFFKPPILNKYRADFAIVTPRNELLMIEIEKPTARLQTEKGDQHHHLTHAFGQLRDWKYEIDIDRDAFLRLIPDCPRDIVKVRYLLIAGRLEVDADMTRKLIATSEFEFMTYDHLIEEALTSARLVLRQFIPIATDDQF